MGSDDIVDIIENETKENIQNLLRYYEYDDSICIDSIKCMPGSRAGDNYMSIVKRIIVTGKQNNNGKNIILFIYFFFRNFFILMFSRVHYHYSFISFFCKIISFIISSCILSIYVKETNKQTSKMKILMQNKN